MKKVLLFVAALCLMSCAKEYTDEVIENEPIQKIEVSFPDGYATMYLFVQSIVESELFGLEMPANPTYDDLMRISVSAICHDLWDDTFGEGDCEAEYRLIYAYYLEREPDSDIVKMFAFILEHELY